MASIPECDAREPSTSFAGWSLFVGLLLITMVLASTLPGRLPLSSAMVYLALGCVLGPIGVDVLQPDPRLHAGLLERFAEVGLLISLFSVGLRLGVPLRDRRWYLPLRLAFLSMAAMVAMVAVVGIWLLGLPLGAAVLLGAILAPTDPVLASGMHSDATSRPDRLGFGLAGEGGFNDGAAVALPGEPLSWPQRALIGWFGIRGIGSVSYLLCALRHGVNGAPADTLVSRVLWTGATSIVGHGLTAQPLTRRYVAWRDRTGRHHKTRDPQPPGAPLSALFFDRMPVGHGVGKVCVRVEHGRR